MIEQPILIAAIVTAVVLLLFADRLRRANGSASRNGTASDTSGSDGGFAATSDCDDSSGCDSGDAGGGDGGGGD